ncbi:hypothetical protein SAMN04488527_1629 [Aliiroseovarius crassostreae]|uniref:Uncharacterized protein n=1 Tax=Aliiroseovarius crassostreae TaxID=154981 RepID=A0A0N8IC20_9RHOB|nr:hypothetical protein [Aliiroseovarius crassostreae]KPN64683.1 hypothetical protein AKJ29_00160 [Aliiroseovarius crassostreae]SFU97628.1 hypothetical protein SAMN04488527_1629 [Aliiroseovarius crassostreae]
MTKFIEVSDGGYVWHIPLLKVAEHRAAHYAQSEDQQQEEVQFVLNDHFEGIDWFQNNMNFEDVADVAELLETPEPKIAPDMGTAECEIVEVAE